MKKILVTSPGEKGFEGAVTLMYGEEGVGAESWPPLLSIDLQGANLSDTRKRYILAHVPERYGPGFEQCWGAAPLQFITEDFELDFERDFFVPYGKPVNKKRCVTLWGNMSRPKKALAVSRIAPYNRHLDRNQWKSKADPETFLKKEMYLNDYDNIQ